MKKRWVVGVTGASGVRYAVRLIECLAAAVDEVHVCFSDAALRVLSDEESIKVTHANLLSEALFPRPIANVIVHNPRDVGASIASGSLITEGMVIIPCSMASLGALAHGVQQHLVHRAAEVTLKEGRRLIVVPRETPLSTIHLENLIKLSRAGARIVPAMPGFYHQPKSIEDLVDMLVMKVLDQMGIHMDLVKRWQGKES
jgi:4-hydroxy-3-polyprenylbenzoate decarboxylase